MRNFALGVLATLVLLFVVGNGRLYYYDVIRVGEPDYSVIIETGREEFERRGFRSVTYETAKTDGTRGANYTIFTYQGYYGDCRVRLVYNSEFATYSYTTGGGYLTSSVVSDVSVSTLETLNRPPLKGCLN